MDRRNLNATGFYLLILVATFAWPFSVPAQQSRPNIVLIVVDTLGAKHLSCYGGSKGVSPNIDDLASKGTRFVNAYSVSSWTKPSITSIITSFYPSDHGVTEIQSPLDLKFTTLAEVATQAGYETLGVVSHTLISPKTNFKQGFSRYELVDIGKDVHQATTSAKVSDRALSFLDAREKSKPFLLFAHYFDPHYNYQHHSEFDRTSAIATQLTPGMNIRLLRDLIPKLKISDIEYLKGLYDEEIAFTDFHIGRLLKRLESEKDLVVLLTADHGEEFMEHGWIGHTRTLYEELVHVPLIVMQRGGATRNLPALLGNYVSLVDILPSLAEVMHAPKSSEWRGESFFNFISIETGEPRVIPLEVSYRADRGDLEAYKHALIQGPLKIINDFKSNSFEAYDLIADPGEKHSIVNDPRFVALREEVAKRWHTARETRPAVEPSKAQDSTPEEVEQLKSLGYL